MAINELLIIYSTFNMEAYFLINSKVTSKMLYKGLFKIKITATGLAEMMSVWKISTCVGTNLGLISAGHPLPKFFISNVHFFLIFTFSMNRANNFFENVPLTGFEQQISGLKNNRSTNLAQGNAPFWMFYLLDRSPVPIHLWWCDFGRFPLAHL